MTNELNKAELRRLAEAAMPGEWFKAGNLLCFDVKTGESHGLNVEDDRFIASVSPGAVLSLLDECDRLQVTCDGLDRQNDAIAEEIGKVAAERDAALAELDACRKDAERYRQLRDGSGWPAVFDNSDDPEPLRGDDLDAAMSQEQAK